MIPATFAIPGDIRTLTGGYIYERRLLENLRAAGREVRHLRLPSGFPDPGEGAMARAVAQLAAQPGDHPLILDGLVYGALDSDGLAQVSAPLVAMIHHPLALESGLEARQRDHLFRTERDNLRLARHVLVPSPHTRRNLIEHYDVAPDRITVASPGIDPPSGKSRPADPPLILSVGIQHPRKGHDVLIAALQRLRGLDWQAVIVGRDWDADHARALARQAARTGLQDRLSLAGQVPKARLHRLYRAASVFALATRYEGYGIVFAEALSYGLPIVSCRTGAVPDTVPAGAGLLVPPDDPDAFAEALRRMLSNPTLRGSCAAAATRAAAGLPGWTQTAAIVGAVLDGL